MALDRKNIDFLATNTLPAFSNWDTSPGASVLVDTATIPPNEYVMYNLNADYNNALDSAEYRRFTLTITTKPGLDSNYTSIHQVLVKMDIVYSANTDSQINRTNIVLAVNEDDIAENADGSFTMQRTIVTNGKVLQACRVVILNTGLNTVEVRDARLQRSADINVGEVISQLKLMQDEMTPKSFKIYEPNMNNILEGLGVIIGNGLELKYKPIREGNRLSSIETNFQDSMPVVYVAEHIDLTTTDDGNMDGRE